MPVRLIALDIDGTLLDSRWLLSDANRCAIQQATARGIEVALVTGRRYDYALPVAKDLGCPVTMIANNGGLTRSSDGQTRLKRLLDVRPARTVLELARPWRDGAAVIFDRPRENQLILERLDPDDSMRYAYYSRNLQYIGIVSPIENCLTEPPLQAMFSGTVSEMAAIEHVLTASPIAAELKLAATKYALKDFAMLDVLPPGCTKGSALAEWAALQGFARSEILAVGDNHNDLEMLEFAGIPVVMQNCVPELKSYGWHETHSNDESGVAAAIDKFALSGTASCA
jgi:Cof subfamily protein (haloacid dehalogenase superfamily)